MRIYSPYNRFNSIVVRLKVMSATLSASRRSCFNSIVVRLKGEQEYAQMTHEELFQFHSGSIKREFVRVEQLRLERFNSIVVRLKVPLLILLPEFPILGFNSIVVRLKGQSTENHPRQQRVFQFHSGSIKSRRDSEEG